MKLLLVVAFLAILASLGSALFFMLRAGKSAADDVQRSKRMARALALRIGLSIVLFVCLLAAWQLGYIQPTGLPVAGR